MNVLLLLMIILPYSVECYPSYANELPNGDNVPHPCKKTSVWKGVGHISMGGGGERNQFGIDFAAASHKWTAELCNKDSDQDGRTNGEELGDPDCRWRPNAVPTRIENITHPGICEPVDSKHCRSLQDYQCAGEYNCSAVNASDVKEFDLRLDYTSVPTDLTTYICQVFKVPQDKKYHAIAFEPLINNSQVLHHIGVLGCISPPKEEHMHPHLCGMSAESCTELVAVWTVGIEGICLHTDTGLPFGNNSFEYFAINVHWTNIDGRTDLKDSSGIRMFYTDKLRPYDESTFTIGQFDIQIQPQQKRVSMDGTCHSKCLQKDRVPHRLNITSALLHMHYLGIGGKAVQYRDGQILRVIFDEKYYYYEEPVLHKFDPPLDWLPGDEFKVTCEFQSMTRNTTTYFGQGTYDEMCFAFFTYYPQVDDLQFCIQFDNYDSCGERQYGDCDYEKFYRNVYGDMLKEDSDFWEHCDVKGGKQCSLECQDAVREMYDSACMKGNVGVWTRNIIHQGESKDLSNAVAACDAVTWGGNQKTNTGTPFAGLLSTSALLIGLMTSLIQTL